VVSGLVKFVPIEEMQGARVICLCNLKPSKIKEVLSQAMVLCASNADHTKVEMLIPPEGANVGERVVFPGYEDDPDEQLNPKKKIFENLKPHLQTTADLVACYKDNTGKEIPFMTSAGPCKAKRLAGGSIS